MTLFLGLAIIAVTIFALYRQAEVRLTLVLSALVLGSIAGDPAAILRTFLVNFSKEQYVVPICSAMGFAHVLRATACDQHLVQLLVRPLRRVRGLLIPGAVLVGFVVNVPVISQTSTAVAVGTVLIPLLRAAHFSPVTCGAALLLGASLGGELLNPGAPELQTVSTALRIEPSVCVSRVLPLVLPHLAVSTLVFWLLSLRGETAYQKSQEAAKAAELPAFRVNLLKALVPAVPFVLLFLTGPPLSVLSVPESWLVAGKDGRESFSVRLIGAAMLIGVVVAALTDRKRFGGTATAFFEGAGYAFTHIVALIVAANCFGKGVEMIGLAEVVGAGIARVPALLLPVAGALPLAFAVLSGSGMAATQSLFGFFVDPSRELGIDSAHVGAVVSLGAAAGRTMSPVAAVTLMAASQTGTSPLQLARRVAVPLLAGMVVVVLAAWAATQP